MIDREGLKFLGCIVNLLLLGGLFYGAVFAIGIAVAKLMGVFNG